MRIYRKLTFKKRRNFSPYQNLGAISGIKNIQTKNFSSLAEIKKLFGTTTPKKSQISNSKLIFKKNFKKIGSINIIEYYFISFDGVKIPVFKLQKEKIELNKKPIIFFSGHGSARDLILGKNIIDFFTNEDFDSLNTYQSRAAFKVVSENNAVYVMENRCMGYLEYLGHYKEVDALYRLSGKSLMGAWLSDAIFLSNLISKNHTNNPNLCGISSGGFLALFASLFANVDKVICQSYLSNFKDSFIKNKSSINNVSYLAKFNFYSVAKFFKKQKITFINGTNDNFSNITAKKEYDNMKKINPKANISFIAPKGLGHEIDIILFNKILNFKNNNIT
jgi:hypothetical protein